MSPAVHLIVSHLVSIVGFGMAIVLVADVLRSRRAAGSVVAWMLAIVLAPYIGVPLYLVLGGRKLRRRSAAKQPLYGAPSADPAPRGNDIERMLVGVGTAPARADNLVELLDTGEAAFAALVALIDSAKTTLDLSTLILAGDEVGAAIVERLTARAQAGVQVRVLIDSLFRFHSNGRELAALTRAGGKLAWFMPVVHIPFRGHANLRLHRKLVIVDGRVAILGGMNIAREYMGPVPTPGRWHDLSMRLSGPAVEDVARIFRSDWLFATHQTSQPSPSEPAVPPDAAPGRAVVQVVGSGPDVASDRIYDALLTAIFGAQQRLWIATPYFVPDEALAKAFVLAARRGVDVRILVPARSNHRIADFAGASYLRDIADAGGKVFCFEPGMMHAKVAVIDDRLGILGSANVDMRSLFLDYEIALFFTSASEVEALAAWFEASLRHTRPLDAVKSGKRLVEDVARVFGPLI
ncbi:MAG TPA: phospholipase D-like domain-containing protein [Polyangia bacterium]|jgi:cardiolipin synthase